MRTQVYFFIATIFIGILSCSREKNGQWAEKNSKPEIEYIQLDSAFDTYQVVMTGYDTSLFNQHYQQRIDPPIINLNQSLENKTISELYLLKQTLLAMKGKVFDDAILASHFKKLPWYQPPFWQQKFEVIPGKEEQIFIDRVDRKIAELKEIQNPVNELVNASHALNYFQYRDLSTSALKQMNANGFVLVNEPANQLSDQYIENAEKSLPPFVTTDLILHQMHLLYGTLENEIEAIYLADILKSMLEIINVELYSAYEKTLDSLIEKTIEESLLYYSIPYGVITGNKTNLIGNYNQIYYEELEKVLTGEGIGSRVIKSDDFDYAVFKPRGHYTKNERIQKYYKALTWLQKICLCLNDDEEFSRAILVAYIINRSEDLKNSYREYVEVKTYFSSQKDQFTFWDLADVMDQVKGIRQFEDLFKAETVAQIKDLLRLKESETCQLRVSLMPVEYQNLYTDLSQIIPENVQPSPVQLFAALGNSTALSLAGEQYAGQIIMEKLLKISTQEEAKSMDWLSTLLTSLDGNTENPSFMNMEAWKKKGLNASMASWVLLNERVNIQIKSQQSNRPQIDNSTILKGYVEPNIDFWNAATLLLSNSKIFLNDRHMLSQASKKHIDKLLDLLAFLNTISEKEISGQTLNNEEYLRIASIGSEIQELTIDLLNRGLSKANYRVSKNMAYATNVFRGGQSANIIAGPGPSHTIIIPVEIEGEIYLTRGAVYSYFQLDQHPKSFISYNEWVKMTTEWSAPSKPWMQEYYYQDPVDLVVASK